MRHFKFACLMLSLVAFCGSLCRADLVVVIGGQSNLFLDPAVLSSLSISIQSTSGTVPPAPGYTVAYPISSRNATPNTTFSYDPTDFLGTFSGVIEHTGTLTLGVPGSTINLGDFTVAFDATRVDAVRSGFYIDDNVDLNAPLFDIALSDATYDATSTSLRMSGSLLLSVEAATGLGNPILANLNVGSGFIEAISAVPEPSSMLMLAGAGFVGGALTRRRKQRSA